MTDKTIIKKEETESVLEAEGIIIENISVKEELEQNLNTPQTEEEERALFEAIGVEIPKKTIKESGPTTNTLKKELDSGGIEVLPTEPLEDGEF